MSPKAPRRTRKRSKTEPPPPPSNATQEYNVVVGAAELADITLLDLNFSLKQGFFDAKRSELSFSFDVEVHHQKPDEENGASGAVFEWNVKAEAGGEEVLSARAGWMAIYHGLKGQSPEAIKRFIDQVGRFATYPYFRAVVAQLSWSSGASLPIMPVLRQP